MLWCVAVVCCGVRCCCAGQRRPYLFGKSDVKVYVNDTLYNGALDYPPFPADSSPRVTIGSGFDGEVRLRLCTHHVGCMLGLFSPRVTASLCRSALCTSSRRRCQTRCCETFVQLTVQSGMHRECVALLFSRGHVT